GFAIWASRTRCGLRDLGLLAPRSQSAPERRSTVPGLLQRWRTVSDYHAVRRPQDKISPVEREGFALDRALTLVVLRTALSGPPRRGFSGHLRQQVASSEIPERGFRMMTEGETQAKEVYEQRATMINRAEQIEVRDVQVVAATYFTLRCIIGGRYV